MSDLSRLLSGVSLICLLTHCVPLKKNTRSSGFQPAQQTEQNAVPQSSQDRAVPEGAVYIATVATRPTCDASRQGMLIYVGDIEEFQTCTNNQWNTVEVAPSVNEKFAKIQQKYRRSVYQMAMTCPDGSVGSGTAFRCATDKICTNKHVVICSFDDEDNEILITSLTLFVAHAEDDDTDLSGTPMLETSNLTIATHPNKDLANVTIAGLPEYSPVIPISDKPARADHPTTTPTMTIGWPLGLPELYTDIGIVNSNKLAYADGFSGDTLDFSTSNDTDQGSSGSPIFDAEGVVFGVVAGGLPESLPGNGGFKDVLVNFTFAVDAHHLKAIE